MTGAKSRLRIISVAVLVFAIVLTGKLYLVQIVSGDNFSAKAEHQYVAGINYFDRGSIFFTTKDDVLVPAAGIQTGFTLYINPEILNRVGGLEETYTKINNITPLDKEVFMRSASDANDTYAELSKQLPQEIADQVRELGIQGVSVARDRWRIYPGENLGAHAIGLIGYSGDELAGRYGLERSYEDVLRRDGDGVFVNFFAEIFANLKSVVSEDDALEGDIITTIEPSMQAFLDKELEHVTDKYSSDFSGGIIINPKTGEIYSMSLTPSFDPNSPGKEESSLVFRNKLIEDRYEMGSIIKALTMAIGLDEGVVSAKTTYTDPGCQTLNTKTFCNYDRKARGPNTSMQDVLNQSLNTGATFVALKVGNKNFNERMLKFGFEGLTNIDLPNEGKSLTSNLKVDRDLEVAQTSFGQGVALTPITTVRALSALANGGTLVTPHIAKKIRYDLGVAKTLDYPEAGEQERVLSPEASIEISRMLTEIVDRSLRNGKIRLDNYSIAAKTGTAQIARSDSAGYYDDRYLHSFFGYFPSYDPEFLVFLYTYYPKGVRFASETLTDSFMNIAKYTINYYDIPPDREAPPPSSSSI